MPQFQHTFTGKDTGVEIKPFDRLQRSQERMDDFLLKAEEMKYNTFKENKDWFLKQTNTDVHKYLWEGHLGVQAKLMKKFNDDVGAVVKKAGGFGNLSLEQQVEIERLRKEVDMAQAKMLADEERLKIDEKLVQSKPDWYSPDKFQERVKSAIETGNYSEEPLPLRSIDPEVFLKAEGQKITSEYSGKPVFKTEGDVVSRGTQTLNFDPNDPLSKDRWIAGKLMSDPRVTQGLMEDFNANATEAEKIKYLDTDGDGSISEDERSVLKAQTLQWGNPILTWAVNNPKYRNAPLNPKVSNWTTVSQKTGGKGGLTINIGGREVAVPIGKQRDGKVNYGGIDYNGNYSFGGNTVLYDIPTTGGKKLSGSTPFGLGNGNAEGQLVDYNPEKDVLIVRAAAGIPKLNVASNQLLEIPASNIEGIDNLPIEVNGKQSTVGALRNKATPTAQRGALDNL